MPKVIELGDLSYIIERQELHDILNNFPNLTAVDLEIDDEFLSDDSDDEFEPEPLGLMQDWKSDAKGWTELLKAAKARNVERARISLEYSNYCVDRVLKPMSENWPKLR